MFFYLSKILGFLITPIVWIAGLLIYSFITKIESRRKKARIWSLALLLFFSNSALYNVVMNWWETDAISTETLAKHDVAIILGGILSVDTKINRIQFSKSNDRLMQAVDLYHKEKIKKIFFVGGSGSIAHPEFKEAVYVRNFLLNIGIPDSAIIIETESRNTHENAINAKKILTEKKISSKVLLITSAFHMPRSIGCFERAGINVTPFSTDRMSGDLKWDVDYWFIPSTEALMLWNVLLHEWVGYASYKLMGYI